VLPLGLELSIMPPVLLRGTLRNTEGREWPCTLTVNKTPTRVNEESDPLGFTYAELNIVDCQSLPTGDYEVEYEGGKELLTKTNRSFVARRRR
jgi:hypothetical protein